VVNIDLTTLKKLSNLVHKSGSSLKKFDNLGVKPDKSRRPVRFSTTIWWLTTKISIFDGFARFQSFAL